MSENQESKQWWRLSKLVPADSLDIVLWASGGAMVLLLILMIIGFSLASSRGSQLAEADKRLEEGGVPRRITSEMQRLEKDAQKAKEDLAAAQQQIEDLSGKLRDARPLTSQLERAEKEKGVLAQKIEALTTDKEQLAQTADERAREIKQLQSDGRRLQREADAAQALRDKQAKLEETLGEKEKEITSLRSSNREFEAEIERQKRKVEDGVEELEKSTQRVERLMTQLSEFPKTPLPEVEAARRYEETQAKVQSMEVNIADDRDERIQTWFMAKRVLAGTRYESAATSEWEREKKLKQVDIDKAAADLHKEALAKIKENPEAYDENIEMLTELLPKVDRSPRNVKAVEKSIEREKRARQASFDRAAAQVYREVIAANKENPEAYDEHIERIRDALPKVEKSPRYVAAFERALTREQTLKERAEARAAAEAAKAASE